ncbi:MAG: hypothetical protein J2P36_31830, partial [Ktedonobacteraceae bacterium]|nr:hypothetical protein [Ktedonobacteraceae bacterium]
IPAPVARVIERAMSLSRADRFSSVAEFWRELNEAVLTSIDTNRLLETPLPFTARDFEGIPTRTLHKKRPPTRPTWKAVLALTLILLGIAAVIVNGILLSAVGARSTQTAHSSPTAPHPSATQNTFTATTTAGGALYPQLDSCYAGTANVSGVTSKSSNMYLNNLQQQQNKITGIFRGLDQVGNFNGTVDATTSKSKPQDRTIHFSVKLPSLGDTLFFDGVPKIGGEIVGEFHSENTQGEKTGYYGVWAVQPCSPDSSTP